MNMNELWIHALREWANLGLNSEPCIELLNETADRLEELDERVAIMSEPTAQDAMDNIGEAFEKFCRATGGDVDGSGQDHGGDPAES